MGRSVTVASGKTNIVLPNGRLYNSGQTVILTEVEWAEVPSSFVPGTIIDNGQVPDPGVESTQDVADRAVRILGTLRAGAAADLFNAANPGAVTLAGSNIAVPVDVQSLYRVQAILTTAALAANAVFTSIFADGLNFRRITGRVFSDVSGSLYIQQSDDGTTWDNANVVTLAAGAAPFYDTPLYTRYVRFYYVNGAIAQTTFRLSGYLAAA